MKYMIVNNTRMCNKEIGLMMDTIIRNGKEDTIYYGKKDVNYLYHKASGVTFKITIVYMKTCTKWIFEEEKDESIHKRG